MKIKFHFDLQKYMEMLVSSESFTAQVRALSRLITLVENEPKLAETIFQHPLLAAKKFENNAHLIGLTGLPGAGKSSLTAHLLKHLKTNNTKIAVLAIDPSSPLSGGAILGDRIRLQQHFSDPNTFIRSMGSRGQQGGLSRQTKVALELTKLLPFDYILVESVGIGQLESQITEMVDTTVLVLMPNSGDEIQLMKAGILQLADIYVVNKCDLSDPSRMIQEIKENTHDRDKNWEPIVLKTSSQTEEGIVTLSESILKHQKFCQLERSQSIEKNKIRFKKQLKHDLMFLFEMASHKWIDNLAELEIEKMIQQKKLTSSFAAQIFSHHVKEHKD